MPIRQSPPGGSRGPRRLHFSYTPTALDEQWHAYIAGPCVWLDCHCKGRTKPCLALVTNHELYCPRCSPLDCPQETGFQPLWRELDWRPVFVIVHSPVREAIAALKHRQRVLVGRGAHDSDGVYVIPPLKSGGHLSSTDEQKLKEQDILPTLIRVWKEPELTVWYERETGRSTGGCDTPPTKTPAKPTVTELADHTPPTVDPVRAAELFPSIYKRLQNETATNGKHDPPDGDGAGG